MVNSGIREESSSIQFGFTLGPISDLSTLLDLSFAMYLPPSELKRMLCTRKEHWPKRDTELRYTRSVCGNKYDFVGRMYSLQHGATRVEILVSGIGEHPNNGNGCFVSQQTGGETVGETAYRCFVDITRREHRLSSEIAGGGHLFREAMLERDTEQIQQAMSSDPTTRMAALAAGQHARLGERSPIGTLNPDVFRALAGLVYDGILKSSVRDHATFYPSIGKEAVGMVNEIIEMRSVLAQRFRIMQARSIVWEYGTRTVSNATSGGPIRYDREHRLSGEHDCGSDDCIIAINGVAYTFQFTYHGIPSVGVDLFTVEKVRRKM